MQEDMDQPHGYRFACDSFSNGLITTPEDIKLRLICNGDEEGIFEVPTGTHR